jgi:hypothetical protein
MRKSQCISREACSASEAGRLRMRRVELAPHIWQIKGTFIWQLLWVDGFSESAYCIAGFII